MSNFRVLIRWSILLLVLLGCAIVVGLFYFPVVPAAKAYRADMLLEQSREDAANKAYAESYKKALSAHLLAPEDHEILLYLVRSTLDSPGQGMHALWARAMDLPERTPDDLKAYVALLKDSDRPDLYYSLLPRLMAELPDDEEVALMQVRRLLDERRAGEAGIIAKRFIDKGTASDEMLASYLNAVFGLSNTRSRAEALRFLNELTKREAPIGAAALRFAINSDWVPSADKPELGKRLLEHPHSRPLDQLIYLKAMESEDGETLARLRDKTLSSLDMKDPQILSSASRWLAEQGLWNQLTKILDETNTAQDKELHGIWLSALIQDGNPQAAYAITVSDDLSKSPLSHIEKLIFRARALRMMDRENESLETLQHAVRISDLSGVKFLEPELLSLKLYEALIELYNKLGQDTDRQSAISKRVLAVYYEIGDEQALMSALNEIPDLDNSLSPSLANFIAYLNLLYGRDLVATRRYIEALVAQYPDIIDFQLTMGLCFLLEGMNKEAEQIAGGDLVLSREAQIPRFLRVIAATLSAAKGDMDQAKADLQEISGTKLLHVEENLLRRYIAGI